MNRENYQVSSSGQVSICDGLHDGDNCAYRPIMAHEMDAMVRKAALFDVLAARVLSGAWHVGPGSIGCVLIDVMTTGERIHGATLAEAVEKAMEAEGGAR